MIRAMWSAATGMQAQQINMDVISNNLANVNTTGFKHSQAAFQDLLYANMRAAGSETAQTGTQIPAGIQLGHGVKVVAVAKDFTQGSLLSSNSGDTMDVTLGINGPGFFQIEMPDGTIAYTRDGNFKINKDYNIVNPDGFLLKDGGSVADSQTVRVDINSGKISATQSDGKIKAGGQLQLARFANAAGLTAIGNNLFKESVASGPPDVRNPTDAGMGDVLQHNLEQSNVNMVTEMVNMITTQRAYEIGTKSIQTVDSMLGLAAGLKR
ncbi:MAG: flagellar basal-body rod protein FlgG [Magnetococcus sp. XQGC-1]